MENRISAFYEDREQHQDDGPQPIGEVLAELRPYQIGHPEVRIAIVETPVAAT